MQAFGSYALPQTRTSCPVLSCPAKCHCKRSSFLTYVQPVDGDEMSEELHSRGIDTSERQVDKSEGREPMDGFDAIMEEAGGWNKQGADYGHDDAAGDHGHAGNSDLYRRTSHRAAIQRPQLQEAFQPGSTPVGTTAGCAQSGRKALESLASIYENRPCIASRSKQCTMQLRKQAFLIIGDSPTASSSCSAQKPYCPKLFTGALLSPLFVSCRRPSSSSL